MYDEQYITNKGIVVPPDVSILTISGEDTEKIAEIGQDGTVTIFKHGKEPEAAKILWENIRIEYNSIVNNIIKIEILRYEVASSWIAPFVSNKWLQNKISSYYAWKVHRKFKRYEYNKNFRQTLLDKYEVLKGEK